MDTTELQRYYYETLYANTLADLEEIEKFPGTDGLPKLNQEDKDSEQPSNKQ